VINLKIRNDFVTNSSSSCFVIAVKNEEISNDAKILLDAILSCSWEDTNCATLLEDEKKAEEYYLSDSDIEEIKHYMDNDWNVYVKYISYEDGAISDIFDVLNEKLDTFKILSSSY
jgi:hypothetical protein